MADPTTPTAVDVKKIYEIGENLKQKLTDKTVFSGEKLVDWFIQNDTQIKSREEAVKLGKHFIEYRIIQHVNDKYTFLDDSSKQYKFCCHSEMIYPRTVSERHTWVQGIEVMRQFSADHNTSSRKRKTSLFNMFSSQNNNHSTFKGKHLLDWLEKNTDFDSRSDCIRFIKALLKLFFIRRSDNDILFHENTDYYFYINSIKGDNSKIRRISNAMKGTDPSATDRCGSLGRKPSVIGLTTKLMAELDHHQPSRDTTTKKIKLKGTCEVLRSSITSFNRCRSNLSESALSTISSNLAGSPESLAGSRVNLVGTTASRHSLVGSRGSLIGSPSRENLVSSNSRSNLTGSRSNLRCSRSRSNTNLTGSQESLPGSKYESRLSEQRLLPVQGNMNTSKSECDLLELIKSDDFQTKLKNIGKSASQNNRHEKSKAEQSRKALLKELQTRRSAGTPGRLSADLISNSSSCPQGLDSFMLKRDWSVETNATRSSGYGSIKERCTSSSPHSSAESVFNPVPHRCTTQSSATSVSASRIRYPSTSSSSSTDSSPKIMRKSKSPSSSGGGSPIAKIRSKLSQELHLKRSIQSTILAMTERNPASTATDRRRARLVRTRALTTDG